MTTIKKILFIPATIYQAKGNANEKWYVYYSYWDETKKPEPGYMRFKVYEELSIGLRKGNKITDYTEKLRYFTKLATHINNQLSNGWSPFGKGYSRKLNTEYMSIDQALNNAIEYKQSSMAATGYSSFKSHIKGFQTWLLANSLSYLKVGDIQRHHIVEFLYSIQGKKKLTNRTINNYLIDIKSCYTMMIELQYIMVNPTVGIALKQTNSNRHLVYEKELLKKVAEYMKEKNPYLQLYCRFIWMGFRPIEIVKLKVSDVNLRNRLITIRASEEKTGETKYRNILATFIPDIEGMNLDQYPSNYYLFSAKGKPDERATTRDYFTDKFKKVKHHFNLPENYTMYGLRHTMAVELFKNGENIRNIMKITGHKTLSAFQAYIDQYLQEPAEDVSHRFETTI